MCGAVAQLDLTRASLPPPLRWFWKTVDGLVGCDEPDRNTTVTRDTSGTGRVYLGLCVKGLQETSAEEETITQVKKEGRGDGWEGAESS